MATQKSNPICAPTLARVRQVSTCIVTAICLSGCASAGYKKADAASYSLHRAALEINRENRAIDFAMASLDNLITQPYGDLRPQYQRFNVAVNELVNASESAEKMAADANKETAEYFKEWDRQSTTIVYGAVRDQSMARRTQVSNELDMVNQRYDANQSVVKPLIAYLTDIRTALSTDLTAGGVESIRPLAANARQNAQKIQTALVHLADDFSASGRQISPVVVQPQQPPEAQATAQPALGTAARGGLGDITQSNQDRAQSTP